MRRLKFTIYHGLAASFALHSALGLPFVLHGLASPPDEPPTLVVDLQGVVAESQAEQKVQQETKGEAKQDEEMAKPATETASEERPVDEKEPAPPPPVPAQTPSPPTEAKSGSAGANDIIGAEERRKAQIIRNDREEDINRLKDYVKQLTKKVRANLVYPDEERRAGLQGAAKVSFVVLSDGRIQRETLKIVRSSGQPKLDASALKTVRSIAPFDPPPKEMTVAIDVIFGDLDRKH